MTKESRPLSRPSRLPEITLLPPETVPMMEDQHRQAVGALATMILSWLERQHREPHGGDGGASADRGHDAP